MTCVIPRRKHREIIAIIPRHPAIGRFRDVGRVKLELIEIVECTDSAELTHVDQAHFLPESRAVFQTTSERDASVEKQWIAS